MVTTDASQNSHQYKYTAVLLCLNSVETFPFQQGYLLCIYAPCSIQQQFQPFLPSRTFAKESQHTGIIAKPFLGYAKRSVPQFGQCCGSEVKAWLLVTMVVCPRTLRLRMLVPAGEQGETPVRVGLPTLTPAGVVSPAHLVGHCIEWDHVWSEPAAGLFLRWAAL